MPRVGRDQPDPGPRRGVQARGSRHGAQGVRAGAAELWRTFLHVNFCFNTERDQEEAILQPQKWLAVCLGSLPHGRTAQRRPGLRQLVPRLRPPHWPGIGCNGTRTSLTVLRGLGAVVLEESCPSWAPEGMGLQRASQQSPWLL